MPTYYVSTLGSDSNTGTSTALAWSTFTKILGSAGISSGDTVYVRPGTYIQTSFTATLTSPTNETQIIGDVAGDIFGVRGQVILSGYSSGITTNPNGLLNLAGKAFLSFRNIYFNGGGDLITLSNASTSCKFIKCTFVSATDANNSGVGLNFSLATANTLNVLVDSCIFNCKNYAINIAAPRSAASGYDIGITIQNSFFMNRAIQVTTSGSGYGSGGLVFINNTVDAQSKSTITFAAGTTNPLHKFYNNLICNSNVAITLTTANSMISDFNKFAQNTTNVSGTHSFGTNDILGGDPGIELGIAFLTQSNILNYGVPFATTLTNILGKGTSSVSGLTIPTTDILGNPRPNPPSIGCFEYFPVFKHIVSNGFVESSRGWNLLSPNSPSTSTVSSSGFVNSLRGWNQIRS